MLKLRKYRRAAGLKQYQLAEIVGCHRVHICRLERGLTNASMPLWMRIKSALNLTETEIIDAMKNDDGGDY